MSGRRARRGALHFVGLGLSAGLLVLVLGLAALLIVVPRITGAVPLTVLTSSMEPALPPGTLIVVRPTGIEDIGIGNVLTYQLESGKPELVTHRVVAIRRSTSGTVTFTTQGDNNPQPDPGQVIAAQVKGTVWYSVPLVGYVAVGLGNGAKSWVVTAIAVALLGYAVFMFSGWFRGKRNRRFP